MSDPTPGNIPPTPVDYPVRYYPANTSYLMPNSRGEWVKASEGGVVTLLMMNGTSGVTKDVNGLTPVHIAMHKIRTELDVTFAGKLAGWPVGEHRVCGQRILVTQGPQLVTARPGKWPSIAKLIAQLFGADPSHGPIQQAVVMGWLRSAWIGLQIGLSTHSFIKI